MMSHGRYKELIWSGIPPAQVRRMIPRACSSLRGLAEYVHDVLDDDERAALFGKTIPCMWELGLRLPRLFEAPLPLLRSGCESTVW